MGTWGDGLYDNDTSLDLLAELMQTLDLEAGPVALATGIGLRAWLDGLPPTDEAELVTKHADWVLSLPDAAREALGHLTADPNQFVQQRSRSPEVMNVLGGYNDGHRYDALLTLPGSQGIIAAFATRAVAGLEDGLTPSGDLNEVSGAWAHLGILLELASAHYWRPDAETVERWQKGFEAVDGRTEDEREYWDRYVRRAFRAITLLKTFTTPH